MNARILVFLFALTAEAAELVSPLELAPKEPVSIDCQSIDQEIPLGGHFQGIQLTSIQGVPHAIISGSSAKESYLMLVRLEGNRAVSVTRRTLLPKPLKHAGGIQVAGRFLAAGIEDNETKDTSRVWILDVDRLMDETPKPLIVIKRQGPVKRSTAGAVGLAKMGKKYLLAVGSWDSAAIDFYESNERPLDAGDCEFMLVDSWTLANADRTGWSDPEFASYQNLNLVIDDMGLVHLVGFANADGVNRADVFKVHRDVAVPVNRRLVKTASHVFQCEGTSFQSGAGLDARLQVVSCAGREWAIESFKGGVRHLNLD